MSGPHFPAFSSRRLLFISVLLAAGCGLSDYETKMAAEQVHVKRIEEENKYLDEPIDLPEKKEVVKKDNTKKDSAKKESSKKESDPESPRPELFLRPPKGISKTAKNDLYGNFLYVYPRASSSSGFLEVYVGLGNEKGYKGKVTKFFGDGKTTRIERDMPGRDSMVFDVMTQDDAKSTISVYMAPSGDYTLVVAFRMDRGKEKENQQKIMDLSLESIGLAEKSVKLRGEYNKRKQVSKTK